MQGAPILVARNAPGYYAPQLVCACLMVLLGAWIVRGSGEPPAWLGWVCLWASGVCAFVLSRRLIDQRPRIVIDSDGVFDRALGLDTIPWDDIANAHALSLFGKDFIGLKLRNTEYWIARMSFVQRYIAHSNRRLGFSPINVFLTGTTLSPALALEVMQKRIAEAAKH